MPKNLLKLTGYDAADVIEDGAAFTVELIPSRQAVVCIYCGSGHLIGHGRAIQTIRDLPIMGKPVSLHVHVKRLRCRSCRKTFMEPLPLIDVKREMTERLVQWAAQQSLAHTFADVAEQIGTDEKTVRNIFRDYIDELALQCRFETPDCMAIDILHLIHPRCVIGNTANNTLIEILSQCDEKNLTHFLCRLPRKERVQCVMMDMWEPYRDAVQSVLPDARIVIDKLYVTRMADAAVEKVRRKLRSELNLKQKRILAHDRTVLAKRDSELTAQERLLMQRWTNTFPVLGQAYECKEAFYAVYEASDAESALRRYDAWQLSIAPELRWAFADLTLSFTGWQNYILEYFNQPFVGAYAEHLSRLMGLLDRLKRGYSFDALRARLLFNRSSHLRNPPMAANLGAHLSMPIANHSAVAFFDPASLPDLKVAELPGEYETSKNFGAEISTLIRLLEEGGL